MKVSNNNYSRYDSVIDNNQKTEQPKHTSRIKNFVEAFRVDLSQKALSSKEYNDPKIHFPIHNSEVIQYTERLTLILK